MKKVVLFFVMLVAFAVPTLAQDGGASLPEWLETVFYILGGAVTLTGLGAWFIKKGVHVFAGKLENGLEKAASALNGVSQVAASAGLTKVAAWTEEIADIPDELGDVAGKVEEMTKNEDFSKERFMELFNEGREVVVEGKEVIMMFKKKE